MRDTGRRSPGIQRRTRAASDVSRPGWPGAYALFAIPVLLSAVLLFTVQPLVARQLLPVLGGSPSVWNACLAFFQAALLVGYLYAHVVATRVPVNRQAWIHAAVLFAAGATQLIDVAGDAGSQGSPEWWLLRQLTLMVGLPFVALSATSPLLQRWFLRSANHGSDDPYVLFALSNVGSLAGLLGYPLLEPFMSIATQRTVWTGAFCVVALLVTICAYVGTRRHEPPGSVRSVASARDSQVVSRARRLRWLMLALVPSALLVGVTQHVATDIVSAPGLWAVPLAIYLVTFSVAFSRGRAPRHVRPYLVPTLAVVVLGLLLSEIRSPVWFVAAVHLLAFGTVALTCHVQLALDRPEPGQLTSYFLWMSAGSVLGSVAVALVAPAVFSSVLEYPIVLAAAIVATGKGGIAPYLRVASPARIVMSVGVVVSLMLGAYWSVAWLDSAPLAGWRLRFSADPEVSHRIVRGLFVVPAVVLLLIRRARWVFAGAMAGLLVAAGAVRTGGDVVHRERTFFGVHQVTSVGDGAFHVLTHGTTTHGVQARRGRTRMLPTAYYHPTGPLGDIVFALSGEGRFGNVSVIGLGAGAVAGYAGERTRMEFFEIDEAVIRIASDPRYFNYLEQARSRPGRGVVVTASDGRLGLRDRPAGAFDLIIVDAFSSDAIPVHLMTREAVQLYMSRVGSRGTVAFHVSSRFFDLAPVLSVIARDLGLVAYVREDNQIPIEQLAEAKRASTWVVLARRPADLGALASVAGRWKPLASSPSARVWTDDYANVLGALAP